MRACLTSRVRAQVEPGRVWWITRPVGTFSKPFFGAEPDGRRIETPPQAMGVVFDAAGKVAKINVGAVMDWAAVPTDGVNDARSALYRLLGVDQNSPLTDFAGVAFFVSRYYTYSQSQSHSQSQAQALYVLSSSPACPVDILSQAGREPRDRDHEVTARRPLDHS